MGSFSKQARKKSWQKAKFEAITSPEGQKAQKAMENMARAREEMPVVLDAILKQLANPPQTMVYFQDFEAVDMRKQEPTIDGVTLGAGDVYHEDFETPEDKLKPRGVYHVTTAGETNSIDESHVFNGRFPNATEIDGKPYLVMNMPDAQLNGLYVDGVRYTQRDQSTRGNVTAGSRIIETLCAPDVYPVCYGCGQCPSCLSSTIEPPDTLGDLPQIGLDLLSVNNAHVYTAVDHLGRPIDLSDVDV